MPFPKAFRFLMLLTPLLLFSCSSDSAETEEAEMNVEVELVFFNHIINLEEDTYVWEYEVKFHNKSGFAVKGVPLVTYGFSNDDITITPGFYEHNNPCPTIADGETCTLSFYQEGDLESEVNSEPVEIIYVKAEYVGERL